MRVCQCPGLLDSPPSTRFAEEVGHHHRKNDRRQLANQQRGQTEPRTIPAEVLERIGGCDVEPACRLLRVHAVMVRRQKPLNAGCPQVRDMLAVPSASIPTRWQCPGTASPRSCCRRSCRTRPLPSGCRLPRRTHRWSCRRPFTLRGSSLKALEGSCPVADRAEARPAGSYRLGLTSSLQSSRAACERSLRLGPPG